MSFNATNKEFKDKYKSQITAIALKNNVDMSVATSMFQANLNNSTNGVLNSSTEYKDGGPITQSQKDDYTNLKNVATKDTYDKGLGYLLERDEPEKKK